MNKSKGEGNSASQKPESVSIDVSDIHELRALLEAVCTAKAFGSKWKPELLGSQPLARISHTLVDALNELAVRTGKEKLYALSEERRTFASQDEFWGVTAIWDVAAENLKSSPGAWADWDAKEKAEYAKLIFSPMLISPELIGSFIREVDGANPDEDPIL